MVRVLGRGEVVGRAARPVVRTTHIDKAGETFAARTVAAGVVGLDALAAALRVTADGLHVLVPAAHLRPGGGGLIGGQELTRDFHHAVEPVTLRWMDRDTVAHEPAGVRPPAGR